ncbi:porin [Rhodospirillaceae bacterium AH-315-P19]|nr:porin [Rhodospirillaceae bacterium AH-315-P19]
MYRKHLIALTAFCMAATSGTAIAQEDAAMAEETKAYSISANVALTSDYMFRGLSQVDGEPTVQGGIDFGYDLDGPADIYLGIWGSGVDFTDATEEFDIYGGLTGEIEGISWDAGFIWYLYPGADSALNYDFVEAAFSLGYDFGPYAISAGLNYSPEYFGDSGDAFYWAGGVDVPLPEGFGLGVHVGYQSIDKNANFGQPDYLDWSVTVSKEFEGLDFSIAYIDTDISNSTCGDVCDTKVVGTISKSF